MEISSVHRGSEEVDGEKPNQTQKIKVDQETSKSDNKSHTQECVSMVTRGTIDRLSVKMWSL